MKWDQITKQICGYLVNGNQTQVALQQVQALEQPETDRHWYECIYNHI